MADESAGVVTRPAPNPAAQNFRAHLEARRLQAERLHSAIRAVIATLPVTARPTAKEVLRRLDPAALDRETLPGERALQIHLRTIRLSSLRLLSLALQAARLHHRLHEHTEPEASRMSTATTARPTLTLRKTPASIADQYAAAVLAARQAKPQLVAPPAPGQFPNTHPGSDFKTVSPQDLARILANFQPPPHR